MLIDFHTHAYPREARENPRAWASERGETHWADLVAPEQGPSLQDWASEERMLGDMETAGVDVAVLQGWYWEQAASCEEQFAYYRTFLAQAPTRLRAFCPLQPNAADAVSLVERAAEAGFAGLGELHPAVQGFELNGEAFTAVTEAAIANQLAVLLHVTEPVGRPHAGAVASPLSEIQRYIERWPKLTIVLAHWGGGLLFHELNPWIRERWQHVRYDSAASPLLYRSEVYRQAVALAGADKLLFGTDYPLRVFPRRQRQASWLEPLEEIRDSGLESADKDALLGGNAARLLGLETA